MKATEWSPSEAIYAFAGWLTTREEPVTFSATDSAVLPAELVDEFCKRYELPEPREGRASR